MNDSVTLSQQMVAAAPAATRNVNLCTALKRMENTGTLLTAAEHNGRKMRLPQAGESAGPAKREAAAGKLHQKRLKSLMLEGLPCQGMRPEDIDCYLYFRQEYDVKLHSGAGVGMARVAPFLPGQQDIRDCVPFLINHDNVS